MGLIRRLIVNYEARLVMNNINLKAVNTQPFIYSFIHLLSVNLLQDMEIVISIILQEKTIHYIHIKFVINLYQYV